MHEIPAFVLILLGIVVALGCVNGAHPRLLRRTKRSLEIIQSILTVFAICVAGYWYFRERTHYPHANVEQKLDARPIGNDMAVIQAELLVTNDGKTLLTLQNPWSVLQIVDYRYSPFEEEISPDVIDESAENEWPEKLFDRGLLRWPTIKRYDPDNLLAGKVEPSKGEIRIEPGETHRSHVEFITPCSAALVAVTSGVERPDTRSKEFSNGLHSSARGYVNLERVCNPEKSDKED